MRMIKQKKKGVISVSYMFKKLYNYVNIIRKPQNECQELKNSEAEMENKMK